MLCNIAVLANYARIIAVMSTVGFVKKLSKKQYWTQKDLTCQFRWGCDTMCGQKDKEDIL